MATQQPRPFTPETTITERLVQLAPPKRTVFDEGQTVLEIARTAELVSTTPSHKTDQKRTEKVFQFMLGDEMGYAAPVALTLLDASLKKLDPYSNVTADGSGTVRVTIDGKYDAIPVDDADRVMMASLRPAIQNALSKDRNGDYTLRALPPEKNGFLDVRSLLQFAYNQNLENETFFRLPDDIVLRDKAGNNYTGLVPTPIFREYMNSLPQQAERDAACTKAFQYVVIPRDKVNFTLKALDVQTPEKSRLN